MVVLGFRVSGFSAVWRGVEQRNASGLLVRIVKDRDLCTGILM